MSLILHIGQKLSIEKFFKTWYHIITERDKPNEQKKEQNKTQRKNHNKEDKEVNIKPFAAGKAAEHQRRYPQKRIV